MTTFSWVSDVRSLLRNQPFAMQGLMMLLAGWISTASLPGVTETAFSDDGLIAVSGKVIGASEEAEANAKVHIHSKYADVDQTVTTDSQGAFTAVLKMDKDAKRSLHFQRPGPADGSRIALAPFVATEAPKDDPVDDVDSKDDEFKLDQIILKLEPAKSIRIRVVDGQGKPIEAAHAAVELHPVSRASSTQTDATGTASIQVPTSQKVVAVVAWKDAVGLDYRLYSPLADQPGDQLAKAPEFPANDTVTLTLEGAQPLQLLVTDHENRPIEKVKSYIWLLQKEQDTQQLNLSMFFEEFAAVPTQKVYARLPGPEMAKEYGHDMADGPGP